VILLLAVIAGLVTGWARARVRNRHLNYPDIREGWLVLLAVIPQLLVFRIPAVAKRLPLSLVIGILVVSQAVLVWFAWRNRHQQGFTFLCAGLFLNLLVMSLNGGLMPIRPEAVVKIFPALSPDVWQVGARLGYGKDIVLTLEQTRLWWLSDYFVLADNPWFRMAFSVGDIFIAVGAFLYLWSLGGPNLQSEKGMNLS